MSDDESILCDCCEGTGTCPDCHGFDDEDTNPCFFCDGSGECFQCDGTGWAVEREGDE